MGGKTGLYDVGVPIKENTKLGYKLAREGDSIDLGYANLNSRRGRVGHQIAHTLTTGIQQGTLHFVDLSPPPLVTEECRSLNTRQCGIHKYKGECSGVLREEGARAVLTPAKRKCPSEWQTYEKSRRTDVHNYCNRSSWHLVSRKNKKVGSEGMFASARDIMTGRLIRS